jgi:hypothetical protein
MNYVTLLLKTSRKKNLGSTEPSSWIILISPLISTYLNLRGWMWNSNQALHDSLGQSSKPSVIPRYWIVKILNVYVLYMWPYHTCVCVFISIICIYIYIFISIFIGSLRSNNSQSTLRSTGHFATSRHVSPHLVHELVPCDCGLGVPLIQLYRNGVQPGDSSGKSGGNDLLVLS